MLGWIVKYNSRINEASTEKLLPAGISAYYVSSSNQLANTSHQSKMISSANEIPFQVQIVVNYSFLCKSKAFIWTLLTPSIFQDRVVMMWVFEDVVKRQFSVFVETLARLVQEPEINIKSKALNVAYTLLSSYPEKEQVWTILSQHEKQIYFICLYLCAFSWKTKLTNIKVRQHENTYLWVSNIYFVSDNFFLMAVSLIREVYLFHFTKYFVTVYIHLHVCLYSSIILKNVSCSPNIRTYINSFNFFFFKFTFCFIIMFTFLYDADFT